ncbi:hypothetical protein HDU98_007419 [Podochytrium sp. JEL0797]|nr:hypothetical protein HDU98_007419 [Podochytrium sp. JEL0797]
MQFSLISLVLLAASSFAQQTPTFTVDADSNVLLGNHTVFNATFLSHLSISTSLSVTQISTIISQIGAVAYGDDLLAQTNTIATGNQVSLLQVVKIAEGAMHHLEGGRGHARGGKEGGRFGGEGEVANHQGNFTRHSRPTGTWSHEADENFTRHSRPTGSWSHEGTRPTGAWLRDPNRKGSKHPESRDAITFTHTGNWTRHTRTGESERGNWTHAGGSAVEHRNATEWKHAAGNFTAGENGNWTHHVDGQGKERHEISSSFVMLGVVGDVFLVDVHEEKFKRPVGGGFKGGKWNATTPHAADNTTQSQIKALASQYNISSKALEFTLRGLPRQITLWNTKANLTVNGTHALAATVVGAIANNTAALTTVAAAQSWILDFTAQNADVSALAVSNVGSVVTKLFLENRYNTAADAETAFSNVAFAKGAVVVNAPVMGGGNVGGDGVGAQTTGSIVTDGASAQSTSTLPADGVSQLFSGSIGMVASGLWVVTAVLIL